MAPRSGYRRVDRGSPLVDLDVVFADDAQIDRIADAATDARDHSARRRGTPDADPVMDLFRVWRAELTAVPLPPAPDVHRPVAIVGNHGDSGKRSMRAVLAVAAAIAALLVGSATVGSRHAAPDSALWAVTQVLWPDRAQSVTSRQNVQDALHQAQAALVTGRTQEAQLALLRAAWELGKVDEVDGRVEMQVQVDQLWRAAAPQDLSGASPAPDLLAGGPVGSVAAAISPSSSTARRTRTTSAPSPSSKPAVRTTAAAATSPSGSPGLLAVPDANAVGSSRAAAGQVPPQAAGTGAVSQQPPIVASPGSPVNAPTSAPAPQPSSPSAVPVAPTTAPAAPPASAPPPSVDPSNAPSTAPALTPPAPGAATSSVPTSPDTTPPAAPPAPAPAPAPTDTVPGPAQTTQGSTGTGAADVASSGQQVPAGSATAVQAPTT